MILRKARRGIHLAHDHLCFDVEASASFPALLGDENADRLRFAIVDVVYVRRFRCL